LGHSFGARLVSYALAGPARRLVRGEIPGEDALPIAGGILAFFAFAEKLPFDGTRSGDLNGMAQRVDGPLLGDFFQQGYCCRRSLSRRRRPRGQDASDATDLMYRWEGMGCDGAQEVDAAIKALEPFPWSTPSRPGSGLPRRERGDYCRWTTEWRSQRHCSPRTAWVVARGFSYGHLMDTLFSCKDRACLDVVVAS